MRQLKNFSGGESDNAADKYAGLSRDQLLDKLRAAVLAAKRDDSYDRDNIRNFINFVTPLLDDEGRKRLKEVVELLD